MIKTKNLIYFLIILVFACKNPKTTSNTPQQCIAKTPPPKQENSLNGVWGMTNYFDTIIATKEIAKYRLQEPTWFAILLKVKDNNLYAYGSIYKRQKTIYPASDTIAIFSHFDCKWHLIKKDSLLTLIRYDSIKKETKRYTYRKRNDLSLLLKEVPIKISYENKFSKNITKYFNKKILSGKYINLYTNEKITFTKEGEIKGMKGYDLYKIGDYFGTLHPYNNLDFVRLINTSNNKTKTLNWMFRHDTLILSRFNVEVVNRFDKQTPTDNFVLGKTVMKLKKIL